MLNIMKLDTQVTPEITKAAREYILEGNILSMCEDAPCEYNALLRMGDCEVWAELTIDKRGNVDDIHCPGSDQDTIPAIAMLFAAELMVAYDTEDLQEALRRSNASNMALGHIG